MARLVVQQPQFMPWIGFWGKIAAADKFVAYGGVKFDKSDHQHRVTIGPNEWVGMQIGRDQRNKLIKDVQIKDFHSLRELAKTLKERFCNKKCPYGDRLSDLISLFETWQRPSMMELDMAVMIEMLRIIHPRCRLQLFVDTTDYSHLKRMEKLQDVVTRYGVTDDYYMGSAGLDYMGFDSLPGHQIYVQRMNPFQSTHSLIETIVTQEHVWDIVEQSSQWLDKDGRIHWFQNGERI